MIDEKRMRERVFAETDPAREREEGEGPGEMEMESEEPMETPEEGDQDRRRDEIIESLANTLKEKRQIAVAARAACGIERIWREDELAIEGTDEAVVKARMMDYATGEASSRSTGDSPNRSRAVINIVRPKCETAEGRFSDVQLPTDDRNWGLKTTPNPELVNAIDSTETAVMKSTGKPAMGPDGQPLKMKDIAAATKAIAEKAMSGMENKIDDQLTECSYNAECRKMIRDSVRLGTGILKGPIVIKDLKKSWAKMTGEGGAVVRVLKIIESQAPASRRVDPWDIFPDPECKEDVSRAGYIWERRSISPRELRGLVGVDGYIPEQIYKVLEEEPTKLSAATDKTNRWVINYETGIKGQAYELWEYNGDIGKEELLAMGVDDAKSCRFPSISACVVMVNDHPIKAVLNPLDTGDLPYDFFQWSERVGVPWGISVPRHMHWTARIIIAAWRAMMDNGGDSAGANVVIGKGIQPMDGQWVITGKKLWRSMDDSIPIDHQFDQFQIENNQEPLQRIIELALRFADMETQLPMLFNGEKGELPETLGATNIMVDSSNVALRSRVKRFDDQVTRPHITRYYDMNMQYGEDDSIKGDYKVDPRGTSVLMERDQEAQDIKEFLALRGDPELKAMIDWEKALKKLILARKADVLLPEDKIKQNLEALAKAPPVGDPAVISAQIRVQGDLQREQIRQQTMGQELKLKAEDANAERQFQWQIKLLEREIEAMKLSGAQGIELEKIKAQLTTVAQKLNVQVELSKMKSPTGTPQIDMPPSEPAQHAPDGQAYQQ